MEVKHFNQLLEPKAEPKALPLYITPVKDQRQIDRESQIIHTQGECRPAVISSDERTHPRTAPPKTMAATALAALPALSPPAPASTWTPSFNSPAAHRWMTLLGALFFTPRASPSFLPDFFCDGRHRKTDRPGAYGRGELETTLR